MAKSYENVTILSYYPKIHRTPWRLLQFSLYNSNNVFWSQHCFQSTQETCKLPSLPNVRQNELKQKYSRIVCVCVCVCFQVFVYNKAEVGTYLPL